MSDDKEKGDSQVGGDGPPKQALSSASSSPGNPPAVAQFIFGLLNPLLKSMDISVDELLLAAQSAQSVEENTEPSELLTRLLLGHEFPALIEEMDRRIGEEIDTQFKEAASKATCAEDIDAIDIDIDEIRSRHERWLKEEIARRMQALLDRVRE